VSTRADTESALSRLGRRHGWLVSAHTLSYYRLQFTRTDGTIRVRLGAGGRISEVTVNLGGSLHQLRLPARARLEEILSTPVEPPPDPWDHDRWVSAWGRNLPLIDEVSMYRLPRTPDGLFWLVTRNLVGGVKTVEVSLMRGGAEGDLTVLDRRRSSPEVPDVLSCATAMVQRLLP
jgi:hypothetical protein